MSLADCLLGNFLISDFSCFPRVALVDSYTLLVGISPLHSTNQLTVLEEKHSVCWQSNLSLLSI